MKVDEETSRRQREMLTKGPKIAHTTEDDFSRGMTVMLIFAEWSGALGGGVRSVQAARLKTCRRCHIFCGTWAAALEIVQNVGKERLIIKRYEFPDVGIEIVDLHLLTLECVDHGLEAMFDSNFLHRRRQRDVRKVANKDGELAHTFERQHPIDLLELKVMENID